MAIFVTREEFENHIGAQKVLDLFDDDRDGSLGDREVANLTEIIAIVNDTTTATLLKKGWELDGLAELSEDRALRFAARQIAASISGERRPEFYTPDGDAPFAAQGKRGNAYLRDLVKGEQRSRAEVTGAGTNQSIRGRVSVSTPARIFGRDPNDPNDLYGDGKGFEPMAETVRADFSAFQHLLDDLERATGDVARVMPVLAEALHSQVMEVFDKEGAVGGNPKWQDLAPSTKKRRRKSARYQILQDTTNLIGNINPDHGDNFVEAWTNVPYAVFHISKAPRRVIPLRDFFAIDQAEFEAEACDIIVAALLGRI